MTKENKTRDCRKRQLRLAKESKIPCVVLLANSMVIKVYPRSETVLKICVDVRFPIGSTIPCHASL